MKLLKKSKSINSSLYKFSRFIKLSNPLNYPLYMMIEPTNYCNLSCPLCATGNGSLNVPRGYMDIKKYQKLIDELSPYLKELFMWGFGEPMMHKQIHEMINYAHNKGVKTKISTNGQFFNSKEDARAIVQSGLTKMKISLDGVSQETLSQYRKKASFDKIIHGIKLINKAKKELTSKTPKIKLQFIVMKHNEHEIDTFKKLAAKLKTSTKIKPVHIDSNKESINAYLPKEQKYARYKLSDNQTNLESKDHAQKICHYPWSWAHVNWDGSVVPCCKDPHRHHILGNAFDAGFLRVWNSEDYINFRKQFIKDKMSLKRCSTCVLPTEI